MAVGFAALFSAAVVLGAEVCRPGNATHPVECVLCTGTATAGSRPGIHYIANAWCSFEPQEGTVDLPPGGWPVREHQRLSIPPTILVRGQLFIRGSNSSIDGGGTVSRRIVANLPSVSAFNVTDLNVDDDVAVVISGTRGQASGFENALVSNCFARRAATSTDVAVVNAGNVTVRGAAVSVLTEHVRLLTSDPPTRVFDVETELRALGSMYVTTLTAAVQPSWVGTMSRANGWLTGTVVVLGAVRYAL